MSLPDTNPSLPEYYSMVLLVDDQPMIAEAVRRALQGEEKIDFHYCHDPAKAVALAKELKPTVILQDLVMPQIDGLSLVRQYRATIEVRETPIIVLSTKEDPRTKSDSFAAGANDYLVKLPDRLELIARLRYHSRAYLSKLQRDEAYRALHDSQQKLLAINAAMVATNQELEAALGQVNELRGLLPICCYCKRIRDDQNYWQQIEGYISQHSEAKFSHSICDECFEREMSELKEQER